jgi:hypothetical protein
MPISQPKSPVRFSTPIPEGPIPPEWLGRPSPPPPPPARVTALSQPRKWVEIQETEKPKWLNGATARSDVSDSEVGESNDIIVLL